MNCSTVLPLSSSLVSSRLFWRFRFVETNKKVLMSTPWSDDSNRVSGSALFALVWRICRLPVGCEHLSAVSCFHHGHTHVLRPIHLSLCWTHLMKKRGNSICGVTEGRRPRLLNNLHCAKERSVSFLRANRGWTNHNSQPPIYSAITHTLQPRCVCVRINMFQIRVLLSCETCQCLEHTHSLCFHKQDNCTETLISHELTTTLLKNLSNSRMHVSVHVYINDITYCACCRATVGGEFVSLLSDGRHTVLKLSAGKQERAKEEEEASLWRSR